MENGVSVTRWALAGKWAFPFLIIESISIVATARLRPAGYDGQPTPLQMSFAMKVVVAKAGLPAEAPKGDDTRRFITAIMSDRGTSPSSLFELRRAAFAPSFPL
jgi:hypothetical protein